MQIQRETIRRHHRHRDTQGARNPVIVLADNVDKASNLGSILRAAEAFRCELVATNREVVDAAGAMGAEHWQPVQWHQDLRALAVSYRSIGYSLIALEQDTCATPLDSFTFPERVVIMIGAEMFGLSADLMREAESTVYIPQAGLVKSLNVAMATSIALYEYGRQHWMPGFEQPMRNLEPSNESVRISRPRIA
jgi:tRNA G18 (ribose-2'-O)-methylase SpoU